MSALAPPSVTVEISDGNLAASGATPPEGPLVICGPCSSGPFTPTPASSPADIMSTFGHGPLVEAALYALAYEVDEVILVRTDPTGGTAGEYGVVTKTYAGAGPDVEVDLVVLPGDDLEPKVRWTKGGILGTTGARYQYSLDRGDKWSGERELGTATSISLPYGGGKFNLKAPLAVLVARVADARTKFLAHSDLTAGGVHGAPDPSTYTITTPTNEATSLTACAELLTSAISHVAEVGGVHGAADATAGAALAALTAPATRNAAVVFIEAFAAAMFGSTGHTTRTASSVHGAADATNVLTAVPASLGAITAGDTFAVTTTAPRWSVDELVAAIARVRDTNLAHSGVIELVGPVMTSGEVLAIDAALEDLGTKVKYVRGVGHFRFRNDGETLSEYGEAFEAAHPLSASISRRLALTPSFYAPSGSNRGAVNVRPWCFFAAARAARVSPSVNPVHRAGFGSATGQIRDANDNVLPRAVDEGFAAVLTARRCWAPMTRPEFPGEILSSQGALLAPEDSDYTVIHHGRVADLACRIARIEAAKRLGSKVLPGPGGRIDPNERKRIEAQVNKILLARVVAKGEAVASRVALDPNMVVVGQPPIQGEMFVYVQPFGSIDAFKVRFALVAQI